MRAVRWVYRELDRVAIIVALPIIGVIASAHPVVGCVGLFFLAGFWHLSNLIRKKEEVHGERFVVIIDFNHLLLLMGLIAMSFLVMRVVLG